MSGLLLKINSMREGLSPAERRVARYVARNAGKVPLQSVQQVSRAAGTSVASVSRLARRLGCRNFKEFKIELAKEAPSSVSAVYEAIAPGDSPGQVVRKVFGGNIHSLRDTLQVVDLGQMQRAAKWICNSQRVVFFGIGSSGNAAAEAALRFAQIDVQAEAYSDSYRMLVEATRLGRHQLAVGISHSGRSGITVEAVRLARRSGAATVGISNYPHAPLRDACDLFFFTCFPETKVKAVALSSLLAQLCLIDALVLLAARHKKVLPKAHRLNALTDQLLRIAE